MSGRCLLHKSKLEAFIEWCEKKNIKTRPGKGPFQVIQVQPIPKGDWLVIFDRILAKEHYIIDKRLYGLVLRFIKEKYIREDKNADNN